MRTVPCIAGLACLILLVSSLKAAEPASRPAVPHIDSVVMLIPQPQEKDPSVIWYDDFDGPEKVYTESAGGLDNVGFGGTGKSMLCLYEQGKQGQGDRKVFFGDSPYGKVVAKGKSFDEIYWRIYVKHPADWTGGGPDKMSRAISFDSNRWNEAMIAHVWSDEDALTLDPASGVRNGKVVTAKYNDFKNLHWLGNNPPSHIKVHSTQEAGRWVCIECHAKLNTPGKADGVNQLWIDGRLECQRVNLDWRGTYTDHGINAVFLEAYWNKGSPVTQRRWYDNFVISTKPIGPVVVPDKPTLIRTPAEGDKPGVWQVEIAADADGKDVVWQGQAQPKQDRITVDASGRFAGSLAEKTALSHGGQFWCRIRQQDSAGAWSDWSQWHQPFKVQDATGQATGAAASQPK